MVVVVVKKREEEGKEESIAVETWKEVVPTLEARPELWSVAVVVSMAHCQEVSSRRMLALLVSAH